MKNKLIKRLASAAVLSALLVSVMPAAASAEAIDPLIVVSLGDSYSSGEGIPAFYGQDKAWEDKIYDEDWLAHRSTKSWPGLLEFSEIDGKLKDYNVKQTNSSDCKWYFGAVSGAETKHFRKERQRKDTYKRMSLFRTLKTTYYMPKQLDVMNKVKGDVDYVTLTVGGNDVGFEEIITTCATGSTYLHFGSGKLKLEKEMDNIWATFAATRADIKGVYNDIQSSAGQQAEIIVAGYPKLLDKEGKGVLISEKEATIVNRNVTKFNNAILGIVNECRNEGMNIHFVDVETEFDKDGGHQAYSDNAWINKIILTKQDQDLDQSGIASAYSIHPNEEGAKAYARCVNAMIREIENEKQARLLSAATAAAQSEVIGSVADASDENAVPENAVINVYSGDELILTVPADAEGNYSFALADGEYTVEISAEGYALSEVPLVIAGGDTAMDTVFLTAEQV
ncbi:carboxypeptidase regulatory-like domain-containing protein [uncultured Ruminococcus sp.]|uniref:carboxypeptidase regulatory-like domain-containing protein n=1 Tax=uncultured Ruminococcus sp. TaxID=165186 RepID=UPI002617728D|nr:carboxypeptidase regulatory-like domain-containing protein [uncultured Ruminococcus sp.]